MKGIFLASIAILLLFLASCSKDTTPASTGNTAVNGWTFKGNAWYTSISKFHGDTLSVVSDTTQSGYNGLLFIFPSVPTVDGTYRVINYATVPAANQVSIFYTIYGFPSVFRSLGNDSINANVTIVNGKISIFVTGVKLLSSTTANDTSVLAASITQLY